MSKKGAISEHQVEEASYLWRFWLVLGVLCVCASALFYRAVDLHVIERSFLANQGDVRSIRFELLEAHRGVITDRNGEPLAVSAPVDTIYANPKELDLDGNDKKRLAAALGIKTSWLESRLKSAAGKNFVYLKRKIAPHEADEVEQLALKGVYRKKEYKRYYPAGEVVSHVVGFTDIDEVGQEGIELAYDAWLDPKQGKKRVIKDRKNQTIKELGEVAAPEAGQDIALSLDMRIQYLAYRELKAAVDTHRAKSGSLVVLDVNTGEVLAMVNQPSYNPNNRQKLKLPSLRNRAVTDVFEPGSTMKLATVSAALETPKYHLGTKLNTSPGFMRVGNKAIRDHRDYGVLNLKEVISKSSNVGTSKLALDLSGDTVWDMFYRLGLGQSTGIGFPGESIGNLPHPSNWKPIEVATMSYGYGLNVTALQLAQAYMVLGNGGIKYPISLLRKSVAEPGERILTSDISQAMRSAMQAVVAKGGTGRRAAVPMYKVGGKTGTVHRVGRGGYQDSEYKALFAGLAPIEKPEVAVVVVIDSPAGEEYYGGEVAAPVFSRVVGGTMRLLNVTPNKELMEKKTMAASKELVPATPLLDMVNRG